MSRSLLPLVLAALLSAGGAQAQVFDSTFKPLTGPDGEVRAIAVRSVLSAVPEAAGAFQLSAPVVYAGVPGIAERVTDLQVLDAQGPVPLSAADDPAVPGGFPYFRRWTPQRPVSYPVTISYMSQVQPAGSPGGPPFGIRPSGRGVSGAGSGFLVIPEHVKGGRLKVAWDLSEMAAGSTGIASFGEGAVELDGAPARLRQAWYLAGPAGRYPAAGQDHGFSAAWLGRSAFDPAVEAQWSARLYTYLGEQFRYLDPPPPYRVFMRFLETPPVGGATALPGSFMLSGPAEDHDPQAKGPRRTLAHEMIHQWVGGIEAPQGVSSWFSEGLTTYYTALLPKRGGFASVEDYGAEINEIAAGYYGVPARSWSAQAITEVGFGDGDIRHIPYNRGALYFADLDARIRETSGGERRLEDALQPLFEAREAGETFDHAAWTAFVVAELGEAEAKKFEDIILKGELIVPHRHAFGPCFALTPKSYVAKGETLQGYAFERVPGFSDDICKAW